MSRLPWRQAEASCGPTVCRWCLRLAGVCLTLVALFFCGFMLLSESGDVVRVPFDETAWRRAGDIGNYRTVRSQMIDDLLHKYDFRGWHRDSVTELLGKPDCEAATLGFKKWHYAYRVGLERGGSFSLDDEWLLFRFDAHDRVVEYLTAVN